MNQTSVEKPPATPSTTDSSITEEPEIDVIAPAQDATEKNGFSTDIDPESSAAADAKASSKVDIENALRQINTPHPTAIKVPRSNRRGLFARFAAIAEVTEPTHYSKRIKWTITATVALAGAAAPMGSAIIFPALHQVVTEFNAESSVTNLTVALYMLSMAIFPMWWSAFSETSGRRTIYIISFILFTLFAALSAVSKSIAMLVVMRMLSGGAAASVQAVGAGTIADIWEPRERGQAMGMFYLGPLCGPLLAPILGGVVGERWNWRATQWALAIYGICLLTLLLLVLPETLKARKDLKQAAEKEVDTTEQGSTERPQLNRTSTRETLHKKSKKYLTILRKLFIDPLRIIRYLRYPAVLLTVYYASVTFGSLYILNVSISYSFGKAPYNYSTIILGLLYIPGSCGYFAASIFGGRWMDFIMKREAIKAGRIGPDGKLLFRPEDRMRENAWLGAVVYPAALVVYGWTVQKGVVVAVPLVANFFYGVGSMLIFAMATTMLTEFMPGKSSSGVALNNLMRNVFSCVGAIVGTPLINAIGNGWLFTILGIWALSSASVIWAMKRYGQRWRATMERENP